MEIRDMSLSEIETRFAEIRSLVESETDMNVEQLEALTKEADLLEERKTQLNKVAEERAALIEQAKYSTQIVAQQEERGKNMEFEKETVHLTPEYRSAWLKTLQNKPLTEVEKRAFSTTGNGGGEAIPTSLSDKIVKKVYQVAPILEHMSLFFVPGNFKWIVQGTENEPSIHVENAAISASADTVTSISLSAYEVTKALRISRTAELMTIDAFENFLVEILGEGLARRIKKFVLNGTGSSQPTGLAAAGSGASGAYVEGTDLISVATAVAVTETHVLNWYKLIGAHQGVKAYMGKNTFMDYFYPLVNLSKNHTIKIEGGKYYIMDVEVFFDDDLALGTAYMAAPKLLFGNFSEQINVRRSAESGFLNNAVDFLATCAFDCKPVTGVKAFTRFSKTL